MPKRTPRHTSARGAPPPRHRRDGVNERTAFLAHGEPGSGPALGFAALPGLAGKKVLTTTTRRFGWRESAKGSFVWQGRPRGGLPCSRGRPPWRPPKIKQGPIPPPPRGKNNTRPMLGRPGFLDHPCGRMRRARLRLWLFAFQRGAAKFPRPKSRETFPLSFLRNPWRRF